MDRMQPRLRQCRPTRDRQLRRTQPKPVPPLRKKMKLRRNFRILESLKLNKSVLDVSRVVVLSLQQERRRYLRSGLKRWVHLAIRAVQPARIEDHLEVGASVDGGYWNVFSLKVWMSAENGSQMRASREADNADAIRIDVPLRGMVRSEPHRLLRVLQIFDIFRKMTLFRHSVLHQNAGHADRVEPITDFSSLKI